MAETRSERIEAAARALLAPRPAGMVFGLPANDATRCTCGCDPAVESLRAALALPHEESVEGWVARDPREALADSAEWGVFTARAAAGYAGGDTGAPQRVRITVIPEEGA